jgi:hypothetical protein
MLLRFLQLFAPEGDGKGGSVMDAINEALGAEANGEGDTNAAVEGDGAVDDAATDDGDSGDHELSLDENSESDDADAGGEGEEDAEGEEGAEGEEKPAAAAKAKEDGTEKPAAKKPDPVNDPIPKDLKKETSDRMRSLISTVKEKDTELAQVRGDFDTIVKGIEATGASPEQYGEVMQWLALFNSNDGDSKRKAYEFVESVADRLATLIGIDRTIADPLAQHADLRNAVAQKSITAEYAKEIARTRNRQGFQAQIDNGQRQREQSAEQLQQEDAKARSDLQGFENEMRIKDPLYERKKELVVAALKPVMKKIPKSQWLETYKEAYANTHVKPLGRPPGKVNQPLRGGKQPAGGQGAAPGSMREAMDAALASMK